MVGVNKKGKFFIVFSTVTQSTLEIKNVLQSDVVREKTG